MNRVYAFLFALVLIFAMPIINNFDSVKIIYEETKAKIEKQISDNELLSFLNSDVFKGGDPDSISPELQYKKEKYELIKTNRLEKSLSRETMLFLSTEVYVNQIREITYKNMPVKKGKVDGWTLVTRYPDANNPNGATKAGTSIALWVNNYNDAYYSISIAGTDNVAEVITQYLPMEISPNRAKQQHEINEFCKDIKSIIRNSEDNLKDPERLYITGHSMGGFFATCLGTDLIDSCIAEITGEETYSLLSIDDMNLTLDREDVYVYSFSAPGMLTQDFKCNDKKLEAFLDEMGLDWLIDFLTPDWAREKQKNNNAGEYKSRVFQYTNSRDFVTDFSKALDTLMGVVAAPLAVIAPSFIHLGTEYQCTSPATSFIEVITFFRGLSFDFVSLLETASMAVGLNYHMPLTYYKEMQKKSYSIV